MRKKAVTIEQETEKREKRHFDVTEGSRGSGSSQHSLLYGFFRLSPKVPPAEKVSFPLSCITFNHFDLFAFDSLASYNRKLSNSRLSCHRGIPIRAFPIVTAFSQAHFIIALLAAALPAARSHHFRETRVSD